MSLTKKSKWILGVLILLAVGLYCGYKYAYKPHKTTEDLKIDYTGNTAEFLYKIKQDANLWNNKAVVLTGLVTSKDKSGVTLNNNIYCQFREDIDFVALKINQEIKLKGRVIGYDDLLEELKLDQCILK